MLIGPAHYLHVHGIAAPTVDAFETPFGRVPTDVEALHKIADLPSVIRADAPHAPEHALEVELPFLQSGLGSFRVVPLLVGDAVPKDVAHVLCQLWGRPETLIVVSSDLSHYHSYETARRLDLSTAAAIERGDWSSLGPNEACGCFAVAGLLMEAKRHVPQFSAVSIGVVVEVDPVPPIAAGRRTPERPNSHRAPQNRNISKKNCSKKKLAKHRPAGSSGLVY